MRYVFDAESNGLLRQATRLWVVVLKCLDTEEQLIFRENDLGWIPYFTEPNNLMIGHNICGYDFILFEKLFNVKAKCKKFDTFLASQILDYNRFGNRHSMEAWGEHFGQFKHVVESFEYNNETPFEEWLDNIVYRCTSDVDLNVRIYETVHKEYLQLFAKKPEIATYLEAEQYLSEFSSRAELHGWPFDVEKAIKLKVQLTQVIENVYEKLNGQLGIKVVRKDEVRGIVDIKRPKWTKQGCYDAHTARWFNVDPWSGYEGEERVVEGAYCRVEFRPLLLSSSHDVKEFLYRQGWVPTEWNYKVKDGVKKKMSPKITEDSLEILGNEGKLYAEYLTAKSRLGILEGWLSVVEDNHLHGSCFTIGTPSMRARHAVIANIPSGERKKDGTSVSAWGPEIRELFTSYDGWKIIGADSSGNQARGLAHYLGDSEYINLILNGDVHEYNKEIIIKVLKDMGITKDVERSQAKRFLYAFLFGAGGDKLWSYIFGVFDKKQGSKLKKGFVSAVPGFESLVTRLRAVYDKVGYVPSIVGNKIYVDSPHKLLVYLLQSLEKITCATALMNTVKELEEKEIPYIPLIMYHDEEEFMVPKEYAEEAAEIAARAFKEAPKLYGITIMDGNAKIGRTWLDVH